MISVSKLYCGEVTPGDWLRYGKEAGGEQTGRIVPKQASERRPIVVWNITRMCNLRCVHCYNDSGAVKGRDELTTEEAKVVLDDLHTDYGWYEKSWFNICLICQVCSMTFKWRDFPLGFA